MQLINVKELKPHARNLEFFDDIAGDSWNTFLESVRTSGVIEPVVITQDKVIVSGHQRVRACKELNIKEVMTEMRSYDTEDHILKDLLETNLRQRGIGNPNPVKFGKCIKELERIYGIQQGRRTDIVKKLDNVDAPTTETEFAEKLGISRQSLQNYKKLAELIPEVQDFLDTGMISATTALAINRQLSIDDQVNLLSKLDATKQYTAKEIQKYIDENNTAIARSRREKFEKSRADRLQQDCDTLKEKISSLEKTISQSSEKSVADNLAAEELKSLKQKYDALLSQQASDKEEIKKLRDAQLSQESKEANTAYGFFKATDKFVKDVVSTMLYDDVIANNQNNECGDYIIKACNMLIDSATDVLRKFKISDVVDFY